MTEAEWLACEDLDRRLTFLCGKETQRKLRLFGIACCRGTVDEITHRRNQPALALAERFADGFATQSERRKQYALLTSDAGDYAPDVCVVSVLHRHASFAAREASYWALVVAGVVADNLVRTQDERPPAIQWAHAQEAARQTDLIRDIFGNPFRPVTFSPDWGTSTAVALASQMYESRDFGAMPILADALQDAGCDNTDVLDHCRDPGPHVRGCWVVDLVLGKE
ncbi:Uncharacterized protein OS=Sorangium cellulosum (strain So ce56) GN=sce5710 PE=4 SV=1 [Gemmata massiliana]|uniref:SMI1/KNR4 family protein n=1 Tax=Gemmata massiliana TaxID=1210884 RepID=A0A6P2D777_9BACT|nr:Uncharacterized protein OS=Sorangium cellulosum (strain So ce56) GN=sce5710 PE=4 SV=1 [Gemmata massiliana]